MVAMTWRRFSIGCLFSLQTLSVSATLVVPARAQETTSAPSTKERQSLEDAWWTGPMLANSANTLPHGHSLVEPYLYDVIGPQSHAVGSRAYLEYGLVDRFTIGVIPIIGYSLAKNGPSSSGVQMGDVSLLAQYRLTQFHEHRWMPTTAIQLQQSFPSGKYDQLGSRPGNGLGSGAYTTTVALNSQSYFWLPNGRILRMRLNVLGSFSRKVEVKDASVYGTTNGFRGLAFPGKSVSVNPAWEYSVTRRWVLAMDGIYQHSTNTSVVGTQNGMNVRLNSGSSWSYGFAPAVEYNMSARLGVIFGARVIAPGRNTARTVAPVIALNFFH